MYAVFYVYLNKCEYVLVALYLYHYDFFVIRNTKPNIIISVVAEYYTPETVITFCEDIKLRTTATPKAGKVILFSYFGAGSTLLANIFKISPDVFFLDEPLMYTADADMLAGGISLRFVHICYYTALLLHSSLLSHRHVSVSCLSYSFTRIDHVF